MIKKYTITLGTVRNGSEVCSNPIVSLIGGTDVAINCIDPEKGIYVVQVDEDSVGPCLEFLVSCGDCHDCPPKVVSRCFCSNNGDCDICEECGPDGLCRPKCPGLCDENGACVDCVDNNDCPNNQVCIGGSCGCPPGANLVNGVCIECTSDSDCELCETCSNDGQCIPKTCPGACNPNTGECVECVNSGDCDINEVCVDNECECAPGFIRRNGVCVPVDCVSDSDCGPCQICSSDSCIPKTCPPGKVPVVIAGQCQCVQECDDNGDCPDGTYCAPSELPGQNGCVPCTGVCARS